MTKLVKDAPVVRTKVTTDKMWIVEEHVPYVHKYLVQARTRAEALRAYADADEHPEKVEWIGYVINYDESVLKGIKGPYATEDDAFSSDDATVDGPL